MGILWRISLHTFSIEKLWKISMSEPANNDILKRSIIFISLFVSQFQVGHWSIRIQRSMGQFTKLARDLSWKKYTYPVNVAPERYNIVHN